MIDSALGTLLTAEITAAESRGQTKIISTPSLHQSCSRPSRQPKRRAIATEGAVSAACSGLNAKAAPTVSPQPCHRPERSGPGIHRHPQSLRISRAIGRGSPVETRSRSVGLPQPSAEPPQEVHRRLDRETHRSLPPARCERRFCAFPQAPTTTTPVLYCRSS